MAVELRKQLQEKPTSDGKPMTRKEADSCIDKALASGALDSDGIFTFRVKGTREQIVERILEVCELWNEPMTRAEAEAKADTAIRVTWGQRVFAWFSWAISVVVIILALLLIISTITVQADPCASIQAMNGTSPSRRHIAVRRARKWQLLERHISR